MREGGFPNPDVTERRQRTEPGMGAGSGDAAPTRSPHGAERGSGAGRVGGGEPQAELPRGERSPKVWEADPSSRRPETGIPDPLKGEPAVTPRAEESREIHPADL